MQLPFPDFKPLGPLAEGILAEARAKPLVAVEYEDGTVYRSRGAIKCFCGRMISTRGIQRHLKADRRCLVKRTLAWAEQRGFKPCETGWKLGDWVKGANLDYFVTYGDVTRGGDPITRNFYPVWLSDIANYLHALYSWNDNHDAIKLLCTLATNQEARLAFSAYARMQDGYWKTEVKVALISFIEELVKHYAAEK